MDEIQMNLADRNYTYIQKNIILFQNMFEIDKIKRSFDKNVRRFADSIYYRIETGKINLF